MLLYRYKAPPQEEDTSNLSKSVDAVKKSQIDPSHDKSDTGSDATLHDVTLTDEKSHDTSHDPQQIPTIEEKATGSAAANGEIAQSPAQTITTTVSSF